MAKLYGRRGSAAAVNIVRIGRSISGDMDDNRHRPRLGKVWNIRRFREEEAIR